MIIATAMLPLSILNIITSTNAFWASVLGYYIVGDIMNKKEIVAMLLGFVGIYLIVKNKDLPADSLEPTS
jgi:drug/metabolite transporter (DMT)-like permease